MTDDQGNFTFELLQNHFLSFDSSLMENNTTINVTAKISNKLTSLPTTFNISFIGPSQGQQITKEDGSFADNNMFYDNLKPAITGITIPPGPMSLKLYKNSVEIAHTTSDSNGNFSFSENDYHSSAGIVISEQIELGSNLIYITSDNSTGNGGGGESSLIPYSFDIILPPEFSDRDPYQLILFHFDGRTDAFTSDSRAKE